MSGTSTGAPLIREMRPNDLEQIVEIDRLVLGKTRRDYWEIKLRQVQNRSQFAALVAEWDGRVIGFIIGGASQGEYGVPENVGWIDTMGVDPEHQRQGVAKLLFREMADNLKQVGVVSLRTFVKRLDWKLLKFFASVGFNQGDMVNLELDI